VSTELAARDIQAALEDREVRSILLRIDSPGGTVDGTDALARRILEARDVKPMVVFADGLMASAAYWIGSAGHMLLTGNTGEVGSIGVIQAHYDYSRADEKAGVKRTFIYAGKYKTAGNNAEPLNDESREYLQAGVDYIYTLFVNAVARHRGVSIAQALAMAEGRIFIGGQAREIGLIDRIGSFETALEIAQDMGRTHYIFGIIPSKEDYIMPNETVTKPITLERLEAEIPDLMKQIRADAAAGVDPEPFRKEGAAAEQARIMGLTEAQFGEEVAAQLKGLVGSNVTVDQLKAIRALNPKPETPEPRQPADKMGDMLQAIKEAGAENPGADSTPGGPATFSDAWKAIKAETNCSTEQAMKQAVRNYPDLHTAFLRGQQAPAGQA